MCFFVERALLLVCCCCCFVVMMKRAALPTRRLGRCRPVHACRHEKLL